MGKGGRTERNCGTHKALQMIPVLATVQNVERQGHGYFITVLVGCEEYSGTFDMLAFENKPDLGWYREGCLDLVYHRDLNFKAGDSFPLWTI
jgi:hypothetical protein